jgi:hypothetical protein
MPIPIPKFIVLGSTGFPAGAPAKACGYQISGRCCYFNPSPDILAENFPCGSPLLQMEAPILPRAPETHAPAPWKKGEKAVRLILYRVRSEMKHTNEITY